MSTCLRVRTCVDAEFPSVVLRSDEFLMPRILIMGDSLSV